MTQTGAHQGVIAMAAARDYATIQDILDSAREKDEAPLIIICDETRPIPTIWARLSVPQSAPVPMA